MRIAVTGGRSFTDWHLVVQALRWLPDDAVLVHGAATGADALAVKFWTEQHRRGIDPHPADWSGPCRDGCRPGHRRQRGDGSSYCPAAGVYRNQEMVDSGLDLLLAFPGGAGTADMRRRCLLAGVKVVDLVVAAPGLGPAESPAALVLDPKGTP